MALSNLRSNRKLKRLAATLGMTEQLAVGLLDYLWWAVYDGTSGSIGSDGGLTGWTVDDIANCAGWPGNANQGRLQDQTNDDFVRALCDAGFLDRLPADSGGQRQTTADGGFAIHDLKDHAPEYVRKRWARQRHEQQNRPHVSETKFREDNGGHRTPTADNGGQRLPTKPNQTKPDQLPAAADHTIGDKPDPAPLPTPSAAAVEDEELKKELNRQGIDAPTDAILAAEFPTATPEMVRTALANVSANAGAGVRVTVLRERLGLSAARRGGVDKLRTLLGLMEPQLAKKYSKNVKAIDEEFRLLDAPGRYELRGNVRREIGRLLPDGDAAKIGIPDMDKAIEAWWRSSDQARQAYSALGFAAIEGPSPAPDTPASKPETLFSE